MRRPGLVQVALRAGHLPEVEQGPRAPALVAHALVDGERLLVVPTGFGECPGIGGDDAESGEGAGNSPLVISSPAQGEAGFVERARPGVLAEVDGQAAQAIQGLRARGVRRAAVCEGPLQPMLAFRHVALPGPHRPKSGREFQGKLRLSGLCCPLQGTAQVVAFRIEAREPVHFLRSRECGFDLCGEGEAPCRLGLADSPLFPESRSWSSANSRMVSSMA